MEKKLNLAQRDNRNVSRARYSRADSYSEDDILLLAKRSVSPRVRAKLALLPWYARGENDIWWFRKVCDR